MIKIKIGLDGKIISSVSGKYGASCKKEDDFLEKLGSVEKENLTMEYYQQEENKNTIHLWR